MSYAIEVNNIYVTFNTYGGKVHAVRDVSFKVKQGETLAIVGESGSGKSVTAKTIMGILSKNSNIEAGSIIYEGKNILEYTDNEMSNIRGSEIGMIFQDPMSSLNPVMKIGKQITEALRLKSKMSKAEAKEKALKLMTDVGIDQVEKRYNQYPFQFSGGMRQRIVIAATLACDPKVLICDEPTTALDVTVQSKILDLIKELQRKRNIAVIFITHDLGVVANVADNVAVMYAGRIVEKGSVRDIFYNPKSPYAMALLASMPDLETDTERELYAIPGTPPNMLFPPKGDAFANRNQFALNVDFEEQPPEFKISDTHVASTWLLHPDAPEVKPQDFVIAHKEKEEASYSKASHIDYKNKVLQVKGLKQHFTSGWGKRKLVVKAVDDISFDIYKGETFGLVGESGCGKTTTGRAIIRLYEPTAGKVIFRGKNIAQKMRDKERRDSTRGIEMIFQDPITSLNPRMTVKEIIGEGLRINKLCKSEAEMMDIIYEMLDVVGLTREHASRYPHEFSGGQRQRIGVARALITNPELVIADEPVSALDVSVQAQVLNLMNSIKKRLGLTILFIAHDLSVVKYFSDRIGVMYYGKLVEVAESEELYRNPLHPYTVSLLSAIPHPNPEYEKTRKLIKYHPSMHNYKDKKVELVEIKQGHFVRCCQDEMKRYLAKLK
ncbi:ABC transporter ATP-binding protein [Clostridium sp. 'deep sea']|uniref:ABC transporter ATP-binding protein n=1 Tax=Clostridium sp. 'deep sea' TaxID=2779445 RepID=UPI0018968133|nr:ABC transporter ATP-binding protein [Clostridium sp. 'deep sea']QOR34779.1 ABC transporter ATP-binding protein [Clostridium sp. 'deep sea']